MQVSLVIKEVIFSLDKNRLVYYANKSIPGGVLQEGEILDHAAERIFEENINKKAKYFEQLYTFSSIKKKEIAVVYYFLLPAIPAAEGRTSWKSANKLKKDAVDYEIIEYALARLRGKIEYTNVVYSLLPQEFTLSMLQQVYEAILGKSLDKRNFRKKILSLKLLSPTGKFHQSGSFRPAALYSFRKKELAFVEVL